MKKKTKDRLIFGLKIITVLSLGVAAGYAIYRRRDKAYNSLPDSKFVGNMMKGKRTELNVPVPGVYEFKNENHNKGYYNVFKNGPWNVVAPGYQKKDLVTPVPNQPKKVRVSSGGGSTYFHVTQKLSRSGAKLYGAKSIRGYYILKYES